MSATQAKRPNDLARIHILQKQLGLSQDDASALKLAITGKASSADMSYEQRAKLAAHMQNLLNKRSSKPSNVSWQAEKITQLWQQLGAAGALRDPSTQGLRAFVKARSASGVSAPQFLPNAEARMIIEALKAMLARHQSKVAA